jgi:O-antigen ligase
LILWRAAWRLFAAHPILGVGPDNFRLMYAPYAGLDVADARVHSNNMYLEVLVGGGLVAAVAFAWFVWAAWRMCATGIARADDGPATLATGVAAAALAIALHGLVDSFLEFTPLYTMFALTLGLAAACARGVEA